MTRASPLKSTLGCVIGFAVSFLPVLYIEGITPVVRLFPVSGDVAAAPGPAGRRFASSLSGPRRPKAWGHPRVPRPTLPGWASC